MNWMERYMYTDIFHSVFSRPYYFIMVDYGEEPIADEQMLELIEY